MSMVGQEQYQELEQRSLAARRERRLVKGLNAILQIAMKTILLFYCALPAAFALTIQTPEAGASPADLPFNAEQSPNPADIVKRWLKVDSVQQLNCLNNGVGQYDKLYDCGGNEAPTNNRGAATI
ncbi:uncharacterized protein AB675_6979 [Cyphellophora attinorum]|uniref:Uncharacterized protein n=1 Tax=Cyphellophora attinorum TaxID=1664694 RepID=A0A0N1HDR9_9EURO|nr:uncharacterized protein AB675_6979 [Phialophora attinorum]KPI43247.1 hypothetical protein AB675_6979 [Phialophora attinorum]